MYAMHKLTSKCTMLCDVVVVRTRPPAINRWRRWPNENECMHGFYRYGALPSAAGASLGRISRINTRFQMCGWYSSVIRLPWDGRRNLCSLGMIRSAHETHAYLAIFQLYLKKIKKSLRKRWGSSSIKVWHKCLAILQENNVRSS